ncbi:MAG: DUF6001 family protein [Pseudomonadota bacterium]
MLFEAEVREKQDQAFFQRRSNVESFLRNNDLSHDRVKEQIRHLVGKFVEPYYVSTVPRGLAGSTSDVDLIILDEEEPDQPGLSNMLFVSGRRFGVVRFSYEDVNQALRRLEEFNLSGLANALNSSKTVQSSLSPRWEHLERIVNGVRLDRDENEFIVHLSTISKSATLFALAALHRFAFLLRMAEASGKKSLMTIYGWSAVMHFFDAVMSAAGEVQSNSKWVLERWQRFRNEDYSDALSAEVRTGESLYQKYISGTLLYSELMDAVNELSAELTSGTTVCTNPVFPENIKFSDMLKGATLLTKEDEGQNNCLISSHVVGAVQNSSFDKLSSNLAASVIDLIETGFCQLTLYEGARNGS